MFKDILENVRNKNPLIHSITNYVTVNGCANILLACGASPIMSDDIDEVEEITSICNALYINIGTLNSRTIPAMLLAGKKAKELDHFVVLDPVGAGASILRTKTATMLLKEVQPTVLKGNISEIKALAFSSTTTKGVDADSSDEITLENLDKAVSFAKNFALETKSIIVITGAIDIVADSQTAYCIFNGNPMMKSVTGTGCQLSAIITAFIASNRNNVLEAVVTAVCAMGICGETAFARLTEIDGNTTYMNYIIDAIYNLSSKELKEKARYEIR